MTNEFRICSLGDLSRHLRASQPCNRLDFCRSIHTHTPKRRYPDAPCTMSVVLFKRLKVFAPICVMTAKWLAARMESAFGFIALSDCADLVLIQVFVEHVWPICRQYTHTNHHVSWKWLYLLKIDNLAAPARPMVALDTIRIDLFGRRCNLYNIIWLRWRFSIRNYRQFSEMERRCPKKKSKTMKTYKNNRIHLPFMIRHSVWPSAIVVAVGATVATDTRSCWTIAFDYYYFYYHHSKWGTTFAYEKSMLI